MTKIIAVAIFLAACTTSTASKPPDAAPCDLVSCAAGAAFDCCPAAAPTPSTTRTKIVQSIAGVNQANWWPDFSGVGGSSRGCMHSLQAGRFALPMPLEEGDRLLSLTVAMIGDDSVTVAIDPLSARPDGSIVVGVIGSIFAPSVSSTWRDYTVDLVDTTVTAGASYWFEVAANKSGACVGAFRLTYDHPGA
ncbi:MAG TPA: hypothetical protein VFO62_10420 [Candidatus Binatia bacterium]|nr:hypothetical protein [Candidatus Binatia bacterium]